MVIIAYFRFSNVNDNIATVAFAFDMHSCHEITVFHLFFTQNRFQFESSKKFKDVSLIQF